MRDKEIIYYLYLGLPNKLIADRLGLSVKTVEGVLTQIYKKNNVKNRVQLLKLLYDTEKNRQ